MYWRQPPRFLSQTLLKTRVKPQKQPLQLFLKKRCSQKCCKFHRKTSVSRSLFNRVASQETQTQMFSCGVQEVFRNCCLQTISFETCCFTWTVLKLAQIGTWFFLREVSKYRVFSGSYFPAIELNTERYKVFSLSAEKYGPEKTPYLDTFQAVFCIKIYSFACQFSLHY